MIHFLSSFPALDLETQVFGYGQLRGSDQLRSSPVELSTHLCAAQSPKTGFLALKQENWIEETLF